MRRSARVKKTSVKWNFKLGKFAKDFVAKWRTGNIFNGDLMTENNDELAMVEKEMGITWGDKTIVKDRIISTDDYTDFIADLQKKGW